MLRDCCALVNHPLVAPASGSPGRKHHVEVQRDGDEQLIPEGRTCGRECALIPEGGADGRERAHHVEVQRKGDEHLIPEGRG